MASSSDLVKYITEQVVQYMSTPRSERRERRHGREHWRTRWFGMLPFSIHMWLRSARRRE